MNVRALQFIMLFLACVLVSACGEKTDPQIRECSTDAVLIESGKLTICGVINPQVINILERIDPETIDIIEISSLGGESADVIRSANILRELDIPVTFTRYCVSTCAHFLLLAPNQVSVSPGTFIAFRHTDSSLADLFEFSSAAIAINYDESRNREHRFYETLGADPQFLRNPTLDLVIDRLNVREIGEAKRRVDIDWSQESWVVYDKEVLEAFLNISIDSDWSAVLLPTAISDARLLGLTRSDVRKADGEIKPNYQINKICVSQEADESGRGVGSESADLLCESPSE